MQLHVKVSTVFTKIFFFSYNKHVKVLPEYGLNELKANLEATLYGPNYQAFGTLVGI